MELINDRYRVIKNLYQNQLISSYIVTDLLKENRRIELNIFNNENINEDIMSFFMSEFLSLTSINSCRITKLHGFGVVDSYDGKQLHSKKYFYSRDCLEDYISILDFPEKIEVDKKIDIFLKVCQGLNYLHIRGLVYGELNLSNIYLRKINGEFDVKLKDIATVELEKHMYWHQKKTHFQFKAPEILYGNKATAASDIYSLGVLFVLFNFMDELTDRNFRQIIDDIKKNNKCKGLSNNNYNRNNMIDIIEMIDKITYQFPDKRYSSITEIVKEVNNILNMKYKPFIRSELEEIVSKTKIIGRDREIKKVLDTNEMLDKGKSLGNVIFINGEHGIGKTRFLREIKYMFALKKMDIYHNLKGRNSTGNSDKPVVDLIKQLLPKCDMDIIEHYYKELSRIIPEIDPESERDSYLRFSSEKEKLYTFNRILSFIKECIKTNPAVFIFDNIHLINDENMELLEYILMNTQNQRVIILLAYCDKNNEESKRVLMLAQRIMTARRVQDIELGSLNIEETALIIRNILGLPNMPMKLASRIYTETYGNPLFIEEVIKNLCAEKLLYVNDVNGSWDVEIDDYDKIPLPSNIYQAVLNQLKSLDSISIDILEIMSLFNASVSVTAISEMLSVDKSLVEDKLEFMVKKGILDIMVEDWGYTYDLHNRGVKTYIYNELDIHEKKEMHRIAAGFLERQYAKEGRENKDELVYHLEKADDKDKAIEYCYETAISMENLQLRNEAIKKLEKALSMFEVDSKSKKKIEILMKIGVINNDLGNNTKALEYYKTACEQGKSLGSFKSCIDGYNKIAEIYLQKNDLEKAKKYIELTKQYLEKFDYEEGYLMVQLTLCRFYFNKQQFDEVIKICNEGIGKCQGKYIELEARFYNQVGIVYLEQSLSDEALEMFIKSKKLFEEINYPRGIALSLNNMGVVYGDFYQDTEESINIYNSMKDICEKHNIIDLQITAEGNLAECYYDMEEFEKSFQYHNRSLELSQKIGYEGQIFSSYINLCKVSLKLFEYRNAYEYFMNAVDELENYPIQRKGFMGEFYRVGGELFYAFGSLDKAEDYGLKALDIYKNDEFMGKWHTEILMQFIKIQKSNDRASISDSVKIIRNINLNYVSEIEKINNLYTLGSISKGNGDLSLSMELFEEANGLAKEINNDRVRVRTLYIKSIFEKSIGKIKLLEEALELAKNEGLKRYEIYIFNSLGDYYFKEKEYYSAIKYYFDACEIIKKIAIQIPEEHRINYMMNLNNMHSFKRLIDINRIYSGRTFKTGLDEILSNNLTIKALEDLFEYKDLFEILANKQFIRAAEKDYDYIIPKEIKNINDVINNLSGDSIKDLDLIVKLASKLTLATRSFILLLDENQDMSVVAAKDKNRDIPSIKFIIEKVNSTKEPLFIAERTNEGSIEDLDILPIGIKAAICIPILKKIGDETFSENDDRRKNISLQEQIVGYLYIDTERILNNFNSQAFNQCYQLRKLIQIIIDNYKLKIIASIDKLTGVFTRKYLEDVLTEELERSSKSNSQFSLIMFDIDKFKNINDKFGHQKGDMVLREICDVVRRNIRKEDTCGRYGGEEFVIILPGVTANDALAIAEKLRNRVEKAKILGDKHPVTMSLGVATYPQHGDMEQELIEKIDQALYVAKESGRNKSQVWNSEISNKVKRKDRLAGIVSGNMVQDNRNVLAMIELIELFKEDMNREDKIYKLLGRIIEISEAQNGMLFIVEDGKVVNKYGRKKFEENWIEVKRYNSDILNSVIREKQGLYRVDWDDISEFDALTGNPDWQSIIVTPLILSQKVKGILYLTVSTRAKEFDFNHFNFVNTLGDITAAIL